VTVALQRRLEALYGLERRKNKLDLDGTRALLAALGDPHTRFRSVHVAGTNGKGSVCAIVERVLREAGVRTGLFTSPHLVDFRERIRVAGRWADDDWLEQALDRIESVPEGRDRTFFEVATALGFLYFAEHGVECAIVEVGLGGRLDTTNVLTPDVCAITSIGMDHAEILGDTLELIAAEKAGIIKPGVPVVTTAGSHALATIESVAAERRAPFRDALADETVWPGPRPGRWRAHTTSWGDLDLVSGIAGDIHENLSCALAVLDSLSSRGLELSADLVERGVRAARWPGRFESCPTRPRLWWDGAHNAAGAAHLCRSWHYDPLPPAECLVLAVSRDKDVPSLLAALAEIVPSRRLFATHSRNERALPPETIESQALSSGWSVAVVPEVPQACDTALASTPEGVVLLAGSLFAVGEAMQSFGGAPEELQ
jgi:dihydrofolate synthase/folylpolyglutamate synthase